MALITEQSESIQLDPTAGFVIKTKIISANDPLAHALSTKVFINVCHDAQVPKPAQDFEPSVIFPLIIDNQWEIPLIVSREKYTKDKKGQPSFVYDCCINTLCFQWCQINNDLRSILIEWCIESIELLFDVILEREYSIPKMLSKGELSQTKILKDELDESGFQKKLQSLKKNETLGLIEEIRDRDQDGMDLDEDMGELPNLMNIKAKDTDTSSKPLIQEISDMQIDVDKKKATAPNTEHTTHRSGQRTSTIDEAPSSLVSTEKLNYSITFKKLPLKHQLLVKFECANLQSCTSIQLSYVRRSHGLILINSDSRYYFNNSMTKLKMNSLEIPLPNDITINEEHIFNSFYVRPEHSLYIFC